MGLLVERRYALSASDTGPSGASPFVAVTVSGFLDSTSKTSTGHHLCYRLLVYFRYRRASTSKAKAGVGWRLLMLLTSTSRRIQNEFHHTGTQRPFHVAQEHRC